MGQTIQMKKLFSIILLTVVLVACKKYQTGMPSASAPSMTGKWNIITVTVIPLDSTGNAIQDGTIDPEPSYFYFQFNENGTWVENLAPTSSPDSAESGNYIMHGDTSFTLTNTHATAKAVECRIISLTDTSFVFTNQRATLYNGVSPGYLKYIFQLQKR
jgi:hypothetical protein